MCPVIFEIWEKIKFRTLMTYKHRHIHTLRIHFISQNSTILYKSASVFTMFSVRWRSGLKLQFFFFDLYPLLPSRITKMSLMVRFQNCYFKNSYLFSTFLIIFLFENTWCLTGSCCQYRVHSSIFTLKTVTDLKALKTTFIYLLTISDFDMN